MDGDFKPADKPAKPLRTALDERAAETPTPDKSNFKTPEEVAAADAIVGAAETLDLPNDSSTHKKPSTGLKGKLAALKIKWPFERKEWMVSAAIIIVCGSIVGYVLTHTGSKPIASATQTKVAKKVPPKPTTVASNLTGLQVDPAINQKPVTGVMIENSQASRPQSGLSEAGVVFEAIAEGGITRFLALYQDTAPADVGPIRSARPYYVRWALGFDATYAHVGGSPQALADIKALGVRDLDQFANAGAYRRAANRPAPHNVYSSIASLNQVAATKGFNTSTYTGFVRKKAAPSTAPNPKVVDFNISGALYNTHYDYSPATNTYNRSMAGGPHVDVNGSRQISPNVVVGLVMPHGYAGKYSVYPVVGSGQAYVFQDGLLTIGTWTKAADKAQITFTDAAGKPLGLNPGQTWLTAIAAANRITYAP